MLNLDYYKKIAKEREKKIAKAKSLPKRKTTKSAASKNKTVDPPKKKGTRQKGSTTRVVDYTSLTKRGGKNTTPGKPQGKGKSASAMTPEAKRSFYDAWQDYTMPKTMLGIMDGVINATTGKKLKQNENLNRLDEVRKSGWFKAGNIGGQMLSYGLGYGGVGKVAGKAAGKMITSKAGKKLVTKVAKNKVFQSTAKKALAKQGQNATKKSIEHAATKQAHKLAKGIVKNRISDATVGTVMNSNIARSEGHKVGSKEWNKSMAQNALLDLATGGVIEVAPTILKSIAKGSKGTTKTVPKIVNGKVKNIKESKTYKDYRKELLDSVKKDENYSVNDVKKYSVNKKASARERLENYMSLKEPKKVGKVTTIQKPYKGISPKTVGTETYATPQISRKTIDDVDYLINNISTGDLKKKLRETFGDERIVPVKNTTIDDAQYKIRINKNTVAKIVSSKKSKENIALLGIVDDVVKNGKHVGSGEYVPHGSKNKLTKRFDYFETPIKIDGKDYIAKFDVEVFPNVNNYKSHDVVHDIKEIDLIPKSNADTGHSPAASDKGKGLLHKISQNSDKVNSEVDLVSAFKNPDFVKYVKERSNGSVPTLAKENGISVNEQSRRLYNDYVKSKDLGADVFKESTQKANTERYGSERGVVNATPYGETTQGAKTILNSPMVDETTKKKLTESINEGSFAKVTVTNKKALSDASSIIDKKGIDGAYDHLKSIVEDGKQPTSDNIALGYKLAENYQKTGDYDKVIDVLADVASMESEAGRTLQSMRIFNSLTPEGRVNAAGKTIARMNKTMDVDVKAPAGLLNKLRNAKTEAEIAAANKAISVDLWNQIPASWVEKANAWRYLSMLGNPKTHVRNMLGNAIFVPVKGIRNMVASGLEKAIIKNGDRSKAILTPKDKSLVKAGADDFANVREVLRGQGKYFEGARDLDSKIFKNKALEGLRKFNASALDKEDEIFMKLSYERSFAQYLKANGIKADNIPAEMLSKARRYASNEALNSTYRDSAYLAEVLQKMKKYSNTRLKDIPVSNGKEGSDKLAEQFAKKVGSTMVEATVPFTKTPINILKRGIDYSPAGIVKGVAKLIKAGGDSDKLIRAISDLSEGLTGSGIMLLGAYAGYNGLAQGSLDTSSRVGKYNKMNGEQPYSIRIGDHTYTMDWAVPVSMPFFVGAELGDTIDKGVKFSDLIDSLSKITDPIFNLSMLSGLNNVLDTAYKNTGNSTAETVKNMGKSYVGQFFPTAGGQLARTLTDETRTTTSTLENSTMRDLKRFYNQMKNKVPGLSDTNQPLVDNWGRTEGKYNAGDYAKSALLNFLSPGTLKPTSKDSVDSELSNLMNNIGDEDANSIAPKSTTKYTVKFEGTEYRMTEKELANFKKARGQEANFGLAKLFEKESYQNKSNDEKVKAIKDVYDKAFKEAQYQFLKGRGESDTNIMFDRLDTDVKAKYENSKNVSKEKFVKSYNAQRSVQSNVAKAVAVVNAGGDYKTLRTINKDIPQSTYEKAKALSALGFTAAEVKKIGRQADANKNGSRTNAEIVAYLSRQNYTLEEKRRLFTALANWNARNPY